MRSRKRCLMRCVRPAVVFFACLFAPCANGNSSEKAFATVSTSGPAAWREVIREKFDEQVVHTWCDAKSLLVWVGKAGEGGETTPNRILHINVITGKKTTIVDAPNTTSDMYCGNDGKTVFYQVLTPPIGRQTWTYEMATGKRRHIGGQLNDYFRAPASPKENIFVVNAGSRKYLRRWKKSKTIDLPDWTVLWFPKDGDEEEIQNGAWTTDGKYFQIGVYLYTPQGKPVNVRKKSVKEPSPKIPYEPIVFRSDGGYYLDNYYRINRVDLFSGKIDTLQFQLYKGERGVGESPNFALDLSPQNEIAYYARPPLFTALKPEDVHFRIGDTRLYMTTLSGAQPVILSQEGGVPRFSPDGNYLAFDIEKRFSGKQTFYTNRDKDPGHELVVLQRSTQSK